MPFCKAFSNPSCLFILERIVVKKISEKKKCFQLPKEEGTKPLSWPSKLSIRGYMIAPTNSEINENNDYMLLCQKVLFPGTITIGQKSMSPWYRLITWRKEKKTRMTRQMVSLLNPDKLAASFQVFERISRQWKYLVKPFVLIFSTAKHPHHRFVGWGGWEGCHSSWKLFIGFKT